MLVKQHSQLEPEVILTRCKFITYFDLRNHVTCFYVVNLHLKDQDEVFAFSQALFPLSKRRLLGCHPR